MWFKNKEVPVSNQTKTIQVFQTWEVRWTSRHGAYSVDTKQEVEIFLSEKDAKDFKESLGKAFRILKHTSGTEITLKKCFA